MATTPTSPARPAPRATRSVRETVLRSCAPPVPTHRAPPAGTSRAPPPTATPTPTPTPTATPTPTPQPSVIAQDTFIRANQAHWGTASDGHAWGRDAATSAAFSITGNTGVVANKASNFNATLGPVASDAE